MKITLSRVSVEAENVNRDELTEFDNRFLGLPDSILRLVSPTDLEGEKFLAAWQSGDESVYDSSVPYYLLETETEDDLGGVEAWFFTHEHDGAYARSTLEPGKKYHFDVFMAELLEAMDWTLEKAQQEIFFRPKALVLNLPDQLAGEIKPIESAFLVEALNSKAVGLEANTIDWPLIQSIQALVAKQINVAQFESYRHQRLLTWIQNLQTEMAEVEAKRKLDHKNLRDKLNVVFKAIETSSTKYLETFCALTVLDETGEAIGTLEAFKGKSGGVSYRGDLIRRHCEISFLMSGELTNLCVEHHWQLVLPENLEPAKSDKTERRTEKTKTTMSGADLKTLLCHKHLNRKGSTVLNGRSGDKQLVVFADGQGNLLTQVYRDTILLSNVDPMTLDWEVELASLKALEIKEEEAEVKALNAPEKPSKSIIEIEPIETMEVTGLELLEKANNLKPMKGGIGFEARSGELVLSISKKVRQSVHVVLRDMNQKLSDLDPRTLNWQVPKIVWEEMDAAQAGRKKSIKPKTSRAPRRVKSKPVGQPKVNQDLAPRGNILGPQPLVETPEQAKIRDARDLVEDGRIKAAQKRKETLKQSAIQKFLSECDKVKIPKKMKWLFWSYDINSLDLKEDKDYIISQVLNYGTWEDLKWLFKVYSEEEIKKIIKNPQRGLWFKKVLNFWTTIFNIQLKKEIRDKAIFR